ncbi:hypothetical protein CERZMDRAFT_40600 [Cercospora zeae-maydis SCOH1-5]|uniref:F-box domain-containing protein n=1 Tax=Cercospora zeae-maydis SCOH1-5 TaxID=717836 RepID=A0A6A6FHH4_9PEZI|nr:hypothetical protein CERZMDRAFT_40600 [Cercospora zeae-maydis SCOH1-5]
MSATDLQKQGRQAYKRGDHTKALEYFNRALGRQQTVQLYDNRAATYEKLNDFKNALRDAKSMIRIGDVDPTGYLRAGRILTKMEKPKAALDIYAYGLKHVKHVGQGYEQLRKLHDEILEKLAPNNSVDPLTVLPRELAISVLEYCTFRERIAISRVSKGWQRFVRSEPSLWSHLDLGSARSKVRTNFVSTAINTGRQKLVAATLNKLFDFDKVLAALLRHCPLEHLTLAQTGFQGVNFVEVLKNSKDKLKLKELNVLNGTEMSQTTLREAATACQSSLEVLHCAHMRSLSFKNAWAALHLPKLKSLSLTADQIENINTHLERFLERSPQLVSLTLINLDQHDHEANGSLINVDLQNTKLQSIYVQPKKPVVIPSRLRALQSLSLRDAMGLTDEAIVAIVKELPRLRSLDLSGSLITGAGVGDLLRMEQLDEMKLHNCQKIGHRDAIDQARKRGVKVEYKMDDWSSGKKVRY